MQDRFIRQHRRRLAIVLGLVVVTTIVAASEPLHRGIRSLTDATGPMIRQHPVAGAALFVLLSALSAVVFFFSTAVITPLAVDAYGTLPTLALLWFGWILGGIATYTIGRFLGRRVVGWLVNRRRLEDYEHRAQRLASFRHMLLFQLSVPSEIPGYVLGMAGARFRTFVPAMALGELPFAVGAVYLGESFLEGNYLLLLTIGIAGVAFSWFVFHRASKTWNETPVTRGGDAEHPGEPGR